MKFKNFLQYSSFRLHVDGGMSWGVLTTGQDLGVVRGKKLCRGRRGKRVVPGGGATLFRSVVTTDQGCGVCQEGCAFFKFPIDHAPTCVLDTNKAYYFRC